MTALHLTPDGEVNPLQAGEFERIAFAGMEEAAEELGLALSTMYRASPGVEETIVEEANSGAYEILLLGASRGLFSDDELGGVIRNLLSRVKPHLGVLVDRGFEDTGHVFFPILNQQDLELVPLLRRLLQNRTRRVTVLDPNQVWTGDDEPWLERAVRVESFHLTEAFWAGVDLVVISPRSWASLKAARSAWLDRLPSVLIFQKGPARL